MGTKKKTTDLPATYNVAGAAAAIGRSPSTLIGAISRGELTTVDGPAGADGKATRVVEAEALRAYRDRLAARAETFTDDVSQAEAKRLRALEL